GPATAARLSESRGLAIDAAGNLYIADTDNYRVRVVNAAGVISTYAGRIDQRNPGLENIPATQAFLRKPGQIALDARGNLFIPELVGELVRRVDTATKIITTVAGTSNPYDGTPGTSAPLNRPISVANDKDGNLYIGDSGHFRVRRIDRQTGVITTIAGDGKEAGTTGATANSIGSFVNISVDPLNRLLIADFFAGLIRSVDLASGTMTTLVDLNRYDSQPSGVVGDEDGNVFIADWVNDQVFYLASSGKLYDFVGSGETGNTGDGGDSFQAKLNGPYGLALDANDGLLICDTGNHRVRRVDLDTGIISPFAGDGLNDSNFDGYQAVEASISAPYGITVNSSGYVYISDQASHNVRYVEPGGLIGTLGGSDVSGFAGDGGPAVLSLFDTPRGLSFYDGELIVADSFNYRVRRFFVKDVENNLLVSPTAITFRANSRGDIPAPQLVVVNSSYVGLNLQYSLSGGTDSGGQWLCADDLVGSTPNISVFFAASNCTVEQPTYTIDLPEGRYTATVVASAPGSPDVPINVELIVDPPNLVTGLKLSPESLRFSVPARGTDTQQVLVSSQGQAALPWTIRRLTPASWLQFNAESGTTPATLGVTVNAATLAPGTYSSVVYFSAAGRDSLLVVTLTVTEPKPVLQIDRDSMLFEAVEGTTAVPNQPLNIYNPGTLPLSWDLAIPSGVNWIRASSSRGTVQP
ncbi:MAG: hypothetical protein ABIZ80_04025, partial [Bryobacteraceae bacterium]